MASICNTSILTWGQLTPLACQELYWPRFANERLSCRAFGGAEHLLGLADLAWVEAIALQIASVSTWLFIT